MRIERDPTRVHTYVTALARDQLLCHEIEECVQRLIQTTRPEHSRTLERAADGSKRAINIRRGVFSSKYFARA